MDGTFCASRYLYDNLTRAKVGTAPVKVCHFNVRGIDRNYDNILLYLKSLDDPFDVICLSECHILQGKSEIDNRYDMTGYDKHIFFFFATIDPLRGHPPCRHEPWLSFN